MDGINGADIDEKKTEFAIFCIENVALKLGKPGDEIYEFLAKKTDILDDYIIPNYDILHTQSKDYIVNDIIEYMKERGGVY